MNDYDKAGRYLIKRDANGFFRWFLGKSDVSFQAWIDARRTALPNQNDLTNDLVAALRDGETLEAICLELESEARADVLTRLLEYLARLWSEPRGPASVSVSCVCGAVLDLTGRSRARELNLRSAIVSGCRLELAIARRHLADESASDLVAGVSAGGTSPWLLPWATLMRGGGESGIIKLWRAEAEHRHVDERQRADVGWLARVFATLVGCRPAWDHGLRGWNMQTSPIFDEARAEGREEEARTVLLLQGREKFRKPPTKNQQKALEAITDLVKLESLARRLLNVDSWAELLNGG